MIDINTGRIAFAVLSFGGVLKMGNKLFAVPWQALHVAVNCSYAVLNRATSLPRIESSTDCSECVVIVPIRTVMSAFR